LLVTSNHNDHLITLQYLQELMRLVVNLLRCIPI